MTGEAAPLRRAQANDWLDDLREFHEAVVWEACGEWRRTQTRRPTPSEIRKLCLDASYDALPPPLPAINWELEDDPAETIARRQAIGEKLGELAKMIRGEIAWPHDRR